MRAAVLASIFAAAASAQQVPVREFTLDNGLKFLIVERKGAPNVAAGWIARVGSVNEHPGITGLSHLFEHLMFKGTQTIGTRNIEEDLKVSHELDRVKEEIRKEERELERRYRLGEIADPKAPDVRTARHGELLKEFDRLTQRQKELLVQTEFDRIYSAAGATEANAGTTEDYTIYYNTVPANKLELWFWMESDRLANPVFREFYAERDVVHEERRLRTDSTPTGLITQQFEAMFWQSSPYGWPVIGWPSDLEKITREDAQDYFARFYAPNNLTVCLVGDLSQAQAETWAKKYFGRLRRASREPEPPRTSEVAPQGEQRMTAWAETNPAVEIRYHSVADGHKDEYALVVLSALLNDRTGRLYKSLVLDQQVANSAAAGQNGLKYEGYFEFSGVAKPGKTPEQVEQALYKEIEKLQSEAVPERELQKVKNQIAASNYRRLESDFGLMYQLLVADAGRGWKSLFADSAKFQKVSAEDIQRVAKKYFTSQARSVLLLYRKEKAEAQRASIEGVRP